MDSLTDMIQLGLSNLWTYGASFLAVLGLLVFIHEWGHYIVARLCGVRVETFSVGFGKEIYGWTAKSGTRWKISLFPLGGYVKMFGDSDPASAGSTDEIKNEDGDVVRRMTEEERSVAFFSKPVWKRALIVFAGPGINYLFAILVLSVLYMSIGRPVTPPVISGVEIGSAAERAHFKPHDIVTSINGTPIDSFDEIRRKAMLTLDEAIVFGIKRGDKEMTLSATPQKLTDTDRFGFVHERGYLGLIGPANGIDITQITSINGQKTDGNLDKIKQMLQKNLGKDMLVSTKVAKGDSTADNEDGSVLIHPPKDLNAHLSMKNAKDGTALYLGVKPGDEVVRYNPFKAVTVAIGETYRITVETLKAIGQMFAGTRSTKELGGIIRIGAMAGDMAERGYISLIVFTALLSINLGMINLFPIPMLDGGHLLFYAVEAVRGKPIPEQVQEYAFRFGLVVLVTLMAFSNLNDVFQLFVFNTK